MGITKDYLRYNHGGSCGCVGSSNGAVVAVDDSTCAVAACENVSFYNLRTREKVQEVSESTKFVTCVASSKDKNLLAVGYADGVVRLFDRSKDYAVVVTFSGHKKGVNCLAFSNDGLTLASGGKDSRIILWDIISESGLFRLNGHKDSITHLQFSQNDAFLISSSKDTFVKFWSIANHGCFYSIFDSHSEVYSFALIENDSLLVVANSEPELLVFELTWLQDAFKQEQDEELVKKKRVEMADGEDEGDIHIGAMQNRFVSVSLKGRLLRQCKGRALQIAMSGDGRLLLCLGADKLIDAYRVFSADEAHKRLSKKLRVAKRKNAEVAVNEADVEKDVTIRITRIGDYRTSVKMKCIDFAPKITAVADSESLIYNVFGVYMNNSVQSIQLTVESSGIIGAPSTDLDNLGHRADVRALSVSSNGSALASAGGDEIMIWNVHSLRAMTTLKDESMGDLTSVLFCFGDGHVVVGGKNGSLHLWDIGACELIETRPAHTGAIWSIISSPDKKGIITCSADKTVKFFSYELVSEGTRKRLSLRERRILEVEDEALCCVASPNGKFIAVGLLNNTAAVYFLDSLKFFLSLYGHSLPVTCITISPDSKLVVTGSADKSIKIWGLDFGDCHKSFHAHDDIVSCVLFSPSEEMLVWSAGKDGKIKQFDAQKFEKVQVLDRHVGEVRALAQNESGAVLYSAAHDKSIRCWELSEEIIIVQEEEEMEREKEYEEKIANDDDVVPGEGGDKEADIAATKNTASIVSTENILEAVDIIRNERVQEADGSDHKPHPLIEAYKSKSLDHFLIDTIARCRSSTLERCLLMVPLSYVCDILTCMSVCVKKHYKVELATHVAIFLIRIHHSYVVNAVEAVPVIEQLRKEMSKGIHDVRAKTAMNLAALELLQLEVEESENTRLFSDLTSLDKPKKKKARKAIIKV